MNHLQLDPRAIASGLMMPQDNLTEEPRLTDAGLFFMLGALAHDDDTDDDTRSHCLAAIRRVLDVAKKAEEFDDRGEALLLALFSEGVDPLGVGNKERLLLTLCRLVSLCVGHGRMGNLIADEKIH